MADLPDLTADDVRKLVELHGLVAIPDDDMPRVLELLRRYRAAMRQVDAAALDLRDVASAQVYRV